MAEKFFYNGVLLPEIPSDMKERYPYYWIRKNENTEHYDLLLTRTIGYYDSEVNGIVYGPNAATTAVVHLRLAFSNVKAADDWDRYQITTTWVALDESRTILWSNHNIPEGSLTATEVYFIGSSPIPDMDAYQIRKETLVGIADQVRRLCETEESMTPKKMKEKLSSLANDDVSGGSGGGWGDGWLDGDNPVPGFSQRTQSVYVDDTATKVASYVFYEYEALEAVNFPAVEKVEDYAFQRSENLVIADLAEVTEVGKFAFSECSSLTTFTFENLETVWQRGFSSSGLVEVDAPKLTTLGHVYSYDIGYIFDGCKSLKSVSIPVLRDGGPGMFNNCSALETVNMPSLEVTSGYTFQNCTSLVSISLPNYTTADLSEFQGCTRLSSVNLPRLTKVPMHMFLDCASLTAVTLPSVSEVNTRGFCRCSSLRTVSLSATKLGDFVFAGCYALTDVYLTSNTMCSVNEYAFVNSNLDEVGISCTIHVPASLVASYKVDSDWQKVMSRGNITIVGM